MWGHPGPGIEPVSSALAVRVSSALPPGKSIMWVSIPFLRHTQLVPVSGPLHLPCPSPRLTSPVSDHGHPLWHFGGRPPCPKEPFPMTSYCILANTTFFTSFHFSLVNAVTRSALWAIVLTGPEMVPSQNRYLITTGWINVQNAFPDFLDGVNSFAFCTHHGLGSKDMDSEAEICM